MHSFLPHTWEEAVSFVVSFTCKRDLQKRPQYVKETDKRDPRMWKAARCLIHSLLPHTWVSFVVSSTCERDLQKTPEYVKETDKSHCGEYALVSSAYVGFFCTSLSHVKETYKSHFGEANVETSNMSYALVSSAYVGVFCRSLSHVKETNKRDPRM